MYVCMYVVCMYVYIHMSLKFRNSKGEFILAFIIVHYNDKNTKPNVPYR